MRFIYIYKPETATNLISWKIKFFQIREIDELAVRYWQYELATWLKLERFR